MLMCSEAVVLPELLFRIEQAVISRPEWQSFRPISDIHTYYGQQRQRHEPCCCHLFPGELHFEGVTGKSSNADTQPPPGV